MSEIEYVFVVQLFVSGILSLVFLVMWRSILRSSYTLLWCLLFLISVVNMLLNAGREFFPDRLIYWVVVNATSLLMQGLLIAGWRLRAGLEAMPTRLLIYFIVVELLVIQFTLITHHMGLRMVLIPYSGAFITFSCAWLLTHANDRKTRPAEYGCAILYIFHGLNQFAAGTIALMQGAEPNEYYLGLYSNVNFLTMPAVFAGLGIFTIIILADDLMQQVKKLEGLLPICAYCKNIRDDGGDWSSMEKYISTRTDAKFSHGICPDCRVRVFAQPS